MVIDDTGSVEDIHAFIYCTKWRSGQVLPMPDRLTTLKDRATQLLIKYKSGAFVTQFRCSALKMVSLSKTWLYAYIANMKTSDQITILHN